MATGPLSIPKEPDIPGIDRSRGRLLRAGRWPHEPVDFAGKRVGVIGTGSTGIQIVQEVGPQAGELYVFQRTPSFTMPMRNDKLDAGLRGGGQAHTTPASARRRATARLGGVRPWTTRASSAVTPPRQRTIAGRRLEAGWPRVARHLHRSPDQRRGQRAGGRVRARQDPRGREGPVDRRQRSSPAAIRSSRADRASTRTTTRPTTCRTSIWWIASPIRSSRSPRRACARSRAGSRARHADLRRRGTTASRAP